MDKCESKGHHLDTFSSADANILFDDSSIKNLDFSKCSCNSLYGLSYQNPGNRDGRKFIARPLQKSDYSKGYLTLLTQLTEVGEYKKELFEAQFDAIKRMPGCHYIIVVEDPGCGESGQIIASASLIVECKFIHNAALRGRIEDVVVDKNYRGMHLGSMLLEVLCLYSKFLGCYKITLDCKEPMLQYYTKLGYVNEGQYFLTQRFSE